MNQKDEKGDNGVILHIAISVLLLALCFYAGIGIREDRFWKLYFYSLFHCLYGLSLYPLPHKISAALSRKRGEKPKEANGEGN